MPCAALGIVHEECLSSPTAAGGTSSSRELLGKGFGEGVEGEEKLLGTGEDGTALDLKSACSKDTERCGKEEWKCDFHDNAGAGGAA